MFNYTIFDSNTPAEFPLHERFFRTPTSTDIWVVLFKMIMMVFSSISCRFRTICMIIFLSQGIVYMRGYMTILDFASELIYVWAVVKLHLRNMFNDITTHGNTLINNNA